MAQFMMMAGFILLICIIVNQVAYKLPVPSLVFFLFLGMLFGVNGIFQIEFDDYALSEIVCSTCLVFIMFYGGFGTNIRQARSVLLPSCLLSTLGVVLTAATIGIFVYFIFGLTLYQSLLVGSVLCSTDAASVFNVLRSKNLALKDHTDSLLEIESGSNDPFSYMMTLIFATLCIGESVSVLSMVVLQLGIGILCGLVVGKGLLLLMDKVDSLTSAEQTILFLIAAFLSYGIASVLQGNGYLSVYICGIWMGKGTLANKKELVHFFDVVTENCQMVIFFLLGLLVTPSQLSNSLIPAFLISVFMIFVARPIICFLLLKPFKFQNNRILVISFAGLRGVASIVFAIMAVMKGVPLPVSLFNIVFLVVLISLLFQGTLLSQVAKKLNVVDPQGNVFKTFNDYQDEADISFVQLTITQNHPFANHKIKDIDLPHELLAVLMIKDETYTMPNGDTMLEPECTLVLAARTFADPQDVHMKEISIDAHHKWCNKVIKDLSANQKLLIVMIKRQKEIIVPNGDTMIHENDRIVLLKRHQ